METVPYETARYFEPPWKLVVEGGFVFGLGVRLFLLSHFLMVRKTWCADGLSS